MGYITEYYATNSTTGVFERGKRTASLTVGKRQTWYQISECESYNWKIGIAGHSVAR